MRVEYRPALGRMAAAQRRLAAAPRRLALALLLALGAAGAAARLEAQEPVTRYISFRSAQVYEAAVKSPAELARAQANIFYMGVDGREWTRLEALLDGYFGRLAKRGFLAADLAALKKQLLAFNVQVDTCNPIGYYSLWQGRVYVDRGLFRGGADPLFVKSVIYHEKVHEQQLRRLDGRALKVDQRQRYQNKLQEIGAHYAQIRWVLERGQGQAVELVLANSAREGMVPNLLRFYPASDPVVQAVRLYLRMYTGT